MVQGSTVGKDKVGLGDTLGVVKLHRSQELGLGLSLGLPFHRHTQACVVVVFV